MRTGALSPIERFLREQRDHALEAIVRELHHAAARRADAVLVRVARRHRLVALEALAEVVLLDEPALDQEVERAIDGRRPDWTAAFGHPALDIVRRQMLGGEQDDLRHRQALLGRRQVVIPEIPPELPEQPHTAIINTTTIPLIRPASKECEVNSTVSMSSGHHFHACSVT